MVNKKLIVISYCCIFLFIYFCAIAYAIIPAYLNKAFHSNINLPKSQATDSAITAVSSIPNSTVFWMMFFVVLIIVVLLTMGSISMFGAY